MHIPRETESLLRRFSLIIATVAAVAASTQTAVAHAASGPSSSAIAISAPSVGHSGPSHRGKGHWKPGPHTRSNAAALIRGIFSAENRVWASGRLRAVHANDTVLHDAGGRSAALDRALRDTLVVRKSFEDDGSVILRSHHRVRVTSVRGVGSSVIVRAKVTFVVRYRDLAEGGQRNFNLTQNYRVTFSRKHAGHPWSHALRLTEVTVPGSLLPVDNDGPETMEDVSLPTEFQVPGVQSYMLDQNGNPIYFDPNVDYSQSRVSASSDTWWDGVCTNGESRYHTVKDYQRANAHPRMERSYARMYCGKKDRDSESPLSEAAFGIRHIRAYHSSQFGKLASWQGGTWGNWMHWAISGVMEQPVVAHRAKRDPVLL
jgi:hypothetical protein